MNLKINRRKLKLKHFFNIQREHENYPLDEDYLYELVSALEQNEMLDSPFTLQFVKRNLKMYDQLGEEDQIRKKHIEILQKFETSGILESIKFDESYKSTFQLKTHPWI